MIGWIDSATERVGPFADMLANRLAAAIGFVRGAFEILVNGDFIGRMGMGLEEDSPLVAGLFLLRERALQVIDAVKSMSEWIQRNSETLMRVMEVFVPAGAIVAALATSIHLVSEAWRILAKATPIGILFAVVAALIYAYQESETFRAVVDRAFKAAGQVIETVMAAVGVAVEKVIAWWTQNRDTVQSTFGQIQGYAQSIWPKVQEIITSAVELVRAVVEKILGNLQEFWAKWGDTIIRLAETAWQLIQRVIEAALDIIHGVIETVLGVITGDWSRAWEGVKMVASGVWEAIKALIRAAMDAALAVIAGALASITAKWSSAWESAKATVSAAWERIKAAVSTGVDSVVTFMSGLPGRILRALGNLGSLLYSAGGDLLRGLANGISGAIGAVVDRAVTAARRVVNAVKGALGIRSPSAVFAEIGKQTGAGWIEGIKAMQRPMEVALTHALPVPNAGGLDPLPITASMSDPAAQGDRTAEGIVISRLEIHCDDAHDLVRQLEQIRRHARAS